MNNEQPDGTGAWDEFRWERFIRENEQKIRRFFRLLDRCQNNPKRAKLLARKLGLHLDEEISAHLFNTSGSRRDDAQDEPLPARKRPQLPDHPSIAEGTKILEWIESILHRHPAILKNPLTTQLITRFPICRAQILAAIISGEDHEPAMLIALLKRGLAACNDCLNAVLQLAEQNLLSPAEAGEVLPHLHALRSSYVDSIGRFRQEWMRRRGAD